jgi:hypothetical protein
VSARAVWAVIILALEIFVADRARAENPLRDFFTGDRHEHCAKGRIFPLFNGLVAQAPPDIVNGFLVFHFLKKDFGVISRKLWVIVAIYFESEGCGGAWVGDAIDLSGGVITDDPGLLDFMSSGVAHTGLRPHAVGSGGMGRRI